eukprot:scaffold17.g567.t1
MELRHRTDYGRGVGSYERECKTLYAHYGGAGTLPALQLRKVVEENFKEWGPIEDVHIVPLKTIAFVRYEWRSSAEFAKAAMHQQTLRGTDTTEVLDVRWANDDPNPRAVARVQREREEAFRDAYVRAEVSEGGKGGGRGPPRRAFAAARVNEMEPEAKRARIQQLHLQATVRPGAAAASYPDTDAQYGGGGGQHGGQHGAQYGAQHGRYWHDYEGWDEFYYAQQAEAQQGADAGAEGTEGGGAGDGAEGTEGGGAGDGAEGTEGAQGEAWAAWRAGHAYPSSKGGPLGAGDGYERYMRPRDVAAEAAYAAWQAQQDAWQQAQQAEQQGPGLDADQAAEEALGLIGGYGSASEEEEEGEGGEGDAGAGAD